MDETFNMFTTVRLCAHKFNQLLLRWPRKNFMFSCLDQIQLEILLRFGWIILAIYDRSVWMGRPLNCDQQINSSNAQKVIFFHCFPSLARRGSRDAPFGSNFMHFLGKNWLNNSLAPPPLGWMLHSLENPGSAILWNFLFICLREIDTHVYKALNTGCRCSQHRRHHCHNSDSYQWSL